MRKLAKNRMLNGLVVITTILWAMGIVGILAPIFPAQAAVTVVANNRLNMSWYASGGMMFSVAGFKITASGGETLNSIKVQFSDVGSSGATPSTMLAAFNAIGAGGANDSQGLCVYRDNNNNGALEPGTDTVVPWEVQPTWTDAGGGVYTTTLDIENQNIPASFTGTENYFVHAKMATSATAGKFFTFTFPGGAGGTIVTSGTSPTITAITTNAVISGGGEQGGGLQVEPPRVDYLYYNSYRGLVLDFNKEVTVASVECDEGSSPGSCAAKYTLKTKAAGDNETITVATRAVEDTSKVILTAHADARISLSNEDNLTITTNAANAPKAADNGMPYVNGAPLMPMASSGSVFISEVQLAGSATTDEFIELYAQSGPPVSLNGYTLKALVANTYVTLYTFGAVSLTSGQFYLLANDANEFNTHVNGGSAADAAFTGVDLAANDTIILIDQNGMVIDQVGIGSSAKLFAGSPIATAPSASQSVERKASSVATAANMAGGGSYASSGNGYNSYNNSFDFVSRTTPDPQNNLSAAEVISGVSNTAPTIEHMPVSQAVAGQDLILHARIMDVETPFQLLSTVQTCYKASNASWPGTCVSGVMVYDVNFDIPAAALTAAGLDYYIKVTDMLSATTYSSANQSVTTEADAQTYAYHINVSTSTGSRLIRGNVYQADCSTGINGANVFIEGTGFSSVTANDGSADGAFRINNVPDGVYQLKANAGGYLDGTIWGVSVNTNVPDSSGWKLCLLSGTAGQGGDSTAPHVIPQAPMDGMKGAPIDIVIDRAPMFFKFDKAMDASTVTCSNCNAATANIKLRKVVGGTSTDITNYNVLLDTGSGVSAHGQTRSFGGSSTMPMAVVEMEALLAKSTDYVIEITSAAKDTAGNSVMGNKSGGGHVITFTTSSTDFNFGSSSGGFGFTEDTTLWQSGNFNAMTSDSAYQQMSAQFDSTIGKWSGGQYNPPYVYGSMPAPGDWNVSSNLGKIIFKFSEAMDSSSVNVGSFRLFTVASNGTETDVTSTKISTVALDVSKLYVTMTVNGTLTAGKYAVKAMSGVRSANGLTLGDPNNPGDYFYRSEFTVVAGTDSTAPSVAASWPADAATNVSMDFGFIDITLNEAVDASNVDSATVKLKAGTTEVPSTIEYDPMSKRISIYPSSALIPGIKYTVTITLGGATGIKDLYGNPSAAASLTRTFTMSTTADATKPRVEFANCDNYSCAITFSKQMNSLKAVESASNATMWTGSVRNPANYTLTFGANGTGSTENLTATNVSFNYDYGTKTVMIQGLSFTGATVGSHSFVLTVANVVDQFSNPIDTAANTAKGVIQNKTATGGMMGPGGGGFMGPSMDGTVKAGGPTGFGMFQAKDTMMMPADARPLNSLAGATSTYMVNFPMPPSGGTANQLNDGAYFKFTFPSAKGFGLTNVVPDPYNPAASDLNWDGPSTVTLKTSGILDDSNANTQGGAANDGVTVSGTTVTVWLNTNGGTTGDPDNYHFELKGITNPTVVQDINSSGYTIDMKAYKADGTLVKSMTSMPFFIMAGGANSIKVDLTAADGNGTMLLMMGSPFTGPQDQTVTIASGTGTYTWSSLPDGCYSVFTEPTITLGANKYSGRMNPEPICLPGSGANWNSGTKVLTKALTLTKFGAGNTAQLTVLISGTFSAAGESVDIFGGGPNSFSVETKTLTGAVTNDSTTLYLPSDGVYMIGFGPAMPKGPQMGMPKMPDWMPPSNINVKVSGVGSTPVIKRTDTNETITQLSFTVNSASKQIIGRVISGQTTLGATYSANGTTLTLSSANGFKDNDYIVVTDGTNTKSGKISSISGTTAVLSAAFSVGFASGSIVYNVLPDANVWANQPMGAGGAGSHATSLTDGSFTLKVSTNGTYEIGAYKPGLGEAPFRSVTVKDNAGLNDGNATADVKIDGQDVTIANPLFIKMLKPDYTISGKVLDASGNSIQYAGIMGQESTTKRMVNTMSDSTGSYVLNVSAGTWVVTAQLPPSTDTCGALSLTVPVTDSNKDTQNLQPTSTTCYTISGNVSIGGAVQTNVPIMIDAWDTVNDWPSGGYHRNENTDSSGNYTVKVGNGTYRVMMFSPNYGEIGQNVTVNGANATANISYDVAALKTLTVSFTGGTSAMRGFVEAKSTTAAVRRGMPVHDLSSSVTMSLPADTYRVMVFVDGMGNYSPTSNVDMTSSGQTVTINLASTNVRTISGTVLDGTDTAVVGAAVTLVNTTTGVVQQDTTDTSGNYTTTVSDGTYDIRVDHKDYSSPAKATITVAANTNYDFDANTTDEDVAVDNDVTAKAYTISGTIYQSDGTTAATSGFVYGETTTGNKAKVSILTDGSYSLSVSDGIWTLKADAPMHSLTTRSGTVAISGASSTGKNITLTADSNDTKKSMTTSLSPTAGASINDTSNTGIEINAGPGVLGRDSSGSVTLEQVDMPSIENNTVVGNFVEVSAKSSDSDVNDLTGDGMEVTVNYTASDLSAAGLTDESLLRLTYYDEPTDSYLPLDNQVCDTTANTCTGYITHLTPIGLTFASVTAPSSTTRRDTGEGATVTAPVAETVVVTPVVDTQKQTTVIVTPTATAETAKPTTAEIVKEAEKQVVSESVLLANSTPILPSARTLQVEINATKVFNGLTKHTPKTAADWSVVNYLAYGTTSKIKGIDVNARLDLLKDYKDVYGKLPSTDKDWKDLAKMAQGDTPSRVLAQEVSAIKAFVKVFKRAVNFKDKTNESFVHQAAYRLQNDVTDSTKEKQALSLFKKAYKYLPQSGFSWAIVRAIAYAGVQLKAETPKEKSEQVAQKPAPEVVIVNAVPVAPEASARNLKAEMDAISSFAKLAGHGPSGDEWNVVNFIAYGSTDASKSLASADRVKVVKQYKSKYGKLPKVDADWQNLAKLVK